MKLLLPAVLLTLTVDVVFGQNLIPNPGFEEADTSAITKVQLRGKLLRFIPVSHLKDWKSTTEPYFLIGNSAPYGPAEGRICCLLITGHITPDPTGKSRAVYIKPDQVYVPLLQPLDSGCTYTITLQLRIPGKQHAPPFLSWELSKSPPVRNTKALQMPLGRYRKNSWFTVTASCVASGGERFLIIGRTTGAAEYTLEYGRHAKSYLNMVLIDSVCLEKTGVPATN